MGFSTRVSNKRHMLSWVPVRLIALGWKADGAKLALLCIKVLCFEEK